MALKSRLWDESYKAEGDLSAKQYYIVELSAADQVDVCDGATDTPYGVLMNKPAAAGRAARVAKNGIVPVVSDGSGTAIAAGDLVGTNSSGKAVKKTADTDLVLGRARQASSADGTIIEVELTLGAQRAS